MNYVEIAKKWWENADEKTQDTCSHDCEHAWLLGVRHATHRAGYEQNPDFDHDAFHKAFEDERLKWKEKFPNWMDNQAQYYQD